MNLDLKVAIIKSGRTQRDVAVATFIPEGRLSDFIRGRANPSSREREALRQLLGRDYFEHQEVASR